MRLGLNLGYWSSGDGRDGRALAQLADDLGYDSCWVAEAYGSDAASVLGYLAASTSRIGLGSAVFQIPGRSPAMTAMTAATLDVLCGGRFRLGLGVSGPQVSEGWHGVRFDAPLARTREYVEILRLALARQQVDYQGSHYRLPLPDGPGKALRLSISPVQQHIPVYLAAVGPHNLRLCGQIADGWLGLFFSPGQASTFLDPIREGRIAAGADPARPLDGFDVSVSLPAACADSVAEAADVVRGHYALYIGGMGSRDKNFYHRVASRLGFAAEADQVQELFLAGRPRDAAAAVPVDLIEATALIGPPERLWRRLQAFAAAGVDTLAVMPFATARFSAAATLTAVAEAAVAGDVIGNVH